MLKRYSLLALLTILCHFSIKAGPWYEKSDFAGEARHRATAFSIGQQGYIGLGHINSGVDIIYDDFWKYDPASNSWSQIASYPEGPCFHATSFVCGNIAFVGSGRLQSGSYSNHFYSYDPTTNEWTQIANLPGLERRGAVSFSISGKGYVGTGQTTSGYSNDFYEYNPSTNVWIARASLPASPRTSSVAFAIGDYGYLGTGDSNSGSTNDFFQFNPALNQWVVKPSVGPTTRQEAVGFSVNGKGYIGTGDDYSSGNNFADFWEYNPTTETWTQFDDFSGTARRYLTAFVIGDRAYAGTGTNGTNFRDFWMFDRNLSLIENELKSMQINLFPNPSVDKLQINLTTKSIIFENTSLTFKLIDLNGNEKVSQKITQNSFDVNVEFLKYGIYFYSVSSDNIQLKTGKILIGNK